MKEQSVTIEAKVDTYEADITSNLARRWGYRVSLLFTDRSPEILQSKQMFETEQLAHAAGVQVIERMVANIPDASIEKK